MLRSQDIWMEQCSATSVIKQRFGLEAAFDYIVAEKLMNYTEAATTRLEFARELPRFVAEVRRMFAAEEMRSQLTRVDQRERNAARRERLRAIKDLLTSPQLGTS